MYGDRYGQAWVVDAFARHGIQLVHSPYDRSALYLNLIPALSAGQAKILDLPKLRSQFLALERRVLRTSGKDIVDHPTGGHDDLANAVAGCLVMAERLSNVVPVYAVAVGGDYSGRSFAEYAEAAEQRLKEEENMSYEEIRLHREREAILGRGYRERGLIQ